MANEVAAVVERMSRSMVLAGIGVPMPIRKPRAYAKRVAQPIMAQ
jgi:hypothetical protein